MTRLKKARQGIYTQRMEELAKLEGIHPDDLTADIATGKTIIPSNANRPGKRLVGIGKGLTVKVNANLGTSADQCNFDDEMEKLRAAVVAGADTVMDLSTGGDLIATRKAMLTESEVPLGTVPIYQAAVEAVEKHGGVIGLTEDDLFRVIEDQAKEGVDFITVHCGLNWESLERLKTEGRMTDVVSRGGAFLTTWMVYHQKENPLYEQYDRLVEIAAKHDVTISLGDGLRPGCLADATDRAQIQELITLGELTDRAWDAGVQVMIEGPGHVPLNEVEMNVCLEKSLCKGAPFYVLGPLVTDVAAGHDHIACAIGGALAGMSGADILCYVTPSEHLRLPDAGDVREGVIATKIAAHAADLARGNRKAWERDNKMAAARKALDWPEQIRLALDSPKADRMHGECPETEDGACSMCGPYCAIKLVNEYLEQS